MHRRIGQRATHCCAGPALWGASTKWPTFDLITIPPPQAGRGKKLHQRAPHTIAKASISTMNSGRDRRLTCTVVLVGSAWAKNFMRTSWCLKYSSMSVT